MRTHKSWASQVALLTAEYASKSGAKPIGSAERMEKSPVPVQPERPPALRIIFSHAQIGILTLCPENGHISTGPSARFERNRYVIGLERIGEHFPPSSCGCPWNRSSPRSLNGLEQHHCATRAAWNSQITPQAAQAMRGWLSGQDFAQEAE